MESAALTAVAVVDAVEKVAVVVAEEDAVVVEKAAEVKVKVAVAEMDLKVPDPMALKVADPKDLTADALMAPVEMVPCIKTADTNRRGSKVLKGPRTR